MPYLDKEEKFYDYGTAQVSGKDVIDINKTGTPFYDDFLSTKGQEYLKTKYNLKGEIQYMTPNEYYEICGKYGFPNSPISPDKLKMERRRDYKIIDHLKEVLTVYKRKFPLPYISIAEHAQEGLHRFYTIGELFGWDSNKYPVLVITHADEEEAKRRELAKRADEISANIRYAIRDALRYYFESFDEFKEQLQWSLDEHFKFDDLIKKPVEFSIEEDPDDPSYYIVKVDIGDADFEKASIHYVEPKENDETDDLDLDDIEIDDLDLDDTEDFLRRHFGDNWRETDPHLKDIFGIKESFNNSNSIVYQCAQEARNYITNKYGTGTDLCGRCIEASDYLVKLINDKGIEAKTVEGYIIYDIDENCSDRAWDEHTWVELEDGTIVDVTVEQFNYQMYEDYPPILIEKDPHGYVYEKPNFLWLDELNESADELTTVGLGIKLRKDIEKGWTKETCHPAYQSKWSLEYPSIGQCAITAMWLNEKMGWDIYETIVNRSRHFFNKDTNGFIYDLTADQFQDSDIDYENCRKREFKDLYRSCKDRYELFKSNLNSLTESVERLDVKQMDEYIQTKFGADVPGEGCIFIATNGKFINIYPTLDDHEDLCYWLEENGFGDNPEDAEWFVDTFNYLRCRNSLHLCFVDLPVEITSSQLYSLEEWMETRVQSGSLQVSVPNGKWRKYSTDDYFPEEIIKLIKRYYSSGTLYD